MNSKVRYELEFCNTIGYHFMGLIFDLPWKIKKNIVISEFLAIYYILS